MMNESELSLDLLRASIETCPIAVFISRLEDPADDGTFRLLYVNQMAVEQTGFARDALVGRRNEEVFPTLRANGFIELFYRVARTGKAELYEDMYYQDENLAAGYSGRVVLMAENIIAIWFENITYRKQIEAEAARAGTLARESQQRAELLAQLEEAHTKAEDTLDTYDLVASAAEDALWEMALPVEGGFSDTAHCRFSDRFAEMLGYSPSELPPQVSTFELVTLPEDRGVMHQGFVALLADPSSRMSTEFRARKKSGELVHLHGTARMRLDRGGRSMKVAGAIRDITRQKLAETELRARLAVIEKQRSLIHDLSTPILEVWEGVIALPIVGALDDQRAALTTAELLREISDKGVRFALVDLTGVEVVDTTTAEHVIRIAQAVRLLGARVMITGVQSSVAQSLVQLGVDLSSIETRLNLRQGLRECLEHLTRDRAGELVAQGRRERAPFGGTPGSRS